MATWTRDWSDSLARIRDVVGHRPRGEEEPFGDLVIGQTLGDQFGDFALARRNRVVWRLVARWQENDSAVVRHMRALS